MTHIRFWSVAACLIAVTSVAAQNLITSATDAIRFSKHDFADTIKVKVMDGAVIVPVEIEGRTWNLLFDTGSPLGLWVGQKEGWMRQMTAVSLAIEDTNREVRKQTIYQIPTMRLGSLQIENYPTIVESVMGVVACNRFDGVLGFNLVGKGLSFKLDTKDSLLIVTDRKIFFAKEEKGLPTAKFRTKRTPAFRPLIYVDTPIGWVETVFDSGALNTWLALPQEQLDYWLAKSPKKQKILDDLTIQTDTTINSTVGLYGLSADTIVGRFLHLPKIRIDNLPINDLYITTAHRTSRVGSAVLKHASLIIDAHRKQFVFVPHDNQDITVGNSEAGSVKFIPSEAGDTLGVLKAVVRKGSAAYQKGVRTGDYLMEVNGMPITDVCTYMLMNRYDEEARLKFRRKATGGHVSGNTDGTEYEVMLKRQH